MRNLLLKNFQKMMDEDMFETVIHSVYIHHRKPIGWILTTKGYIVQIDYIPENGWALSLVYNTSVPHNNPALLCLSKINIGDYIHVHHFATLAQIEEISKVKLYDPPSLFWEYYEELLAVSCIWGQEWDPEKYIFVTNLGTQVPNNNGGFMVQLKSKVIGVKFPTNSQNYYYYVPAGMELSVGNKVVVKVGAELKIVEVVEVEGLSAHSLTLATKFIIQKIDLEGYQENMRKLEKVREIENMLDERLKQYNRYQMFKQIAAEDEEMKKLLKELNEIAPELEATKGLTDGQIKS